MPVTELDARTALVLIDLQRAVVSLPLAHPVETVVANAVRLAEAFRARQAPVVLVTVSFAADGADALQPRTDQTVPRWVMPPEGAQIVPELGPQAGDILITKRQWGAFYGTDLDLQLRRRGVTGIVLGGIATSIGVESTARAAFEHGYNQTFALDAMTDRDLQAHEHVVARIFPRLGQQDSTDAILACWQG